MLQVTTLEEGIRLGTGLVLVTLVHISALVRAHITLTSIQIETSLDVAIEGVVCCAAESASIHVLSLDSGHVAAVARDVFVQLLGLREDHLLSNVGRLETGVAWDSALLHFQRNLN